MSRAASDKWPSQDQFEADAALVVAAAVMGVKATFEAPDEEYAERVYARAEHIMRRLESM